MAEKASRRFELKQITYQVKAPDGSDAVRVADYRVILESVVRSGGTSPMSTQEMLAAHQLAQAVIAADGYIDIPSAPYAWLVDRLNNAVRWPDATSAAAEFSLALLSCPLAPPDEPAAEAPPSETT